MCMKKAIEDEEYVKWMLLSIIEVRETEYSKVRGTLYSHIVARDLSKCLWINFMFQKF